jgi:hypothetical protein
MPLPTNPPGEIPTDVCCDSFFEAAEALLESAYDSLAECLGDACRDVAHFVSVNEPTFTGDGNYISVWLRSMNPTAGPNGARGRAIMPRPRATYGFKLVETGYPTLESSGAGILPPFGDHVHAVARHSYSHMEKITRTLYNDFRSRTLPSGCQCGGAELGAIRPTIRSGGIAGWIWDLTLDVCW